MEVLCDAELHAFFGISLKFGGGGRRIGLFAKERENVKDGIKRNHHSLNQGRRMERVLQTFSAL